MTSDVVLGRSSLRATPGRPTPPPFGARDVFARLALIATYAAILGIFAISPVALEALGIPYVETGGFLSKFHPATTIALAAFVLRCLAARRPIHLAGRLITNDAGVLLLLAGVVVGVVAAQFVDKTPVTPLIDTFILPVLVFVLLRDLDHVAAKWLAALVTLVLIANAGLAIVELFRGFHLIQVEASSDLTNDPTKPNAVFSWKAELVEDWRAEALLGHPLVNGLIVGSLLICLAAPGASWIPILLRVGVFALQAASLFAFGARTALVTSAVFVGWLVAMQGVEAIGRGARLTARSLAPGMLAFGAAVIVLVLLVYSGLIDRTLDRFSNDNGSATARMTMFQLFDPIPFTDLVLHPDKDLVATLQRVYGLEFGIESSWIGLMLTYGIIVAVILAASFIAFWRSVLRATGPGAIAVFLFYLVQVSVTANLSGKTTTLAMVVALVVLFLRNDAPPAGASVESSVHGLA